MSQRIAHFLLLAGCLAAASCNGAMEKTKQAAISEVPGFHVLYNAENYGGILAMADPMMLEVASKYEVTGFVKLVYQKMGPYMTSTATRCFFDKTRDRGTPIAVVELESDFERGHGRETFTYRIYENDKMGLIGYNLAAPQMSNYGGK
jgi:hypothetical protein